MLVDAAGFEGLGVGFGRVRWRPAGNFAFRLALSFGRSSLFAGEVSPRSFRQQSGLPLLLYQFANAALGALLDVNGRCDQLGILLLQGVHLHGDSLVQHRLDLINAKTFGEGVARRDGGRGKEKTLGANDPKGKRAPRATDKIGAFVGVSGRTVEKIAAVVAAAERDPEKYGKFVEHMDERPGRVDYVYKKVKNAEKQEAYRERAEQGGKVAR